MPEKRLLEVFKRYLDDTISPEEMTYLFDWIKEHGEPPEEVLSALLTDPAFAEHGAVAEKEEVWASLVGRVQRPVRWLRPLLTAAAVVVLLAGAGYLYYREKVTYYHEKVTPPPVQAFDAPPGIKGATLTLSNGSVVSLDPGAASRLPDKDGSAHLSRKDNQLVYAAGAPGAMVYNTLKTERGRDYSLVLSDGTKVWLNAGSSIRFPAQFEGDKRAVEVTGEVYFDVAAQKGKPFVVKSGGVETMVLGTRFDVMSYADEPGTVITLLQGAVRVSDGGQTVLLGPGRQADVRQGKLSERSVDGNRVIAWTKGLLDLDNADFGALMRQISRWYDVDVIFKGMPQNVHIGGVLHRDVHLSIVLQYLSENGIHYTTEGKTITILP